MTNPIDEAIANSDTCPDLIWLGNIAYNPHEYSIVDKSTHVIIPKEDVPRGLREAIEYMDKGLYSPDDHLKHQKVLTETAQLVAKQMEKTDEA